MRALFVLLAMLPVAVSAAPLKPAGGHNSNAPIAIDANSLEVLQNENKAIFTGNVVATQDTMTLKSDTMVVHYRQKNEGTPAAASATPAADDSMQNSISRIDVNGNVFIASPTETAKGDNGIYDVDKKMIFLTGNVAITKGKNVIKGNAAQYNVATGRSLLTAGGTGASSGGRVRGLFIPGQQ